MKKLLFLFCISIATCSWGLELSEIRTEIRLHVKDSNTNRQNYSNTQLNNLVNQAHRDVVNATWIIKKSTSIALTVGATYYTLPTDTIQIQRVTFKEGNLPESSLQELDGRFSDSSWTEQGGYPDSYYQNPALPESIGIYPWPDSVSSTGTIKVNYFASGNLLLSDSDEPYDGDDRYQQYSDLLIYYPVYKLMIREGLLDKASEFLKLYESRLAVMMERIGERPNFLPSFGGNRSQ